MSDKLREAAREALDAMDDMATDAGLTMVMPSRAAWFDDARDRLRAVIAEPGRQPSPPCIGRDPLCPCQDGDVCHYRDSADGKTKAMPVPERQPMNDWQRAIDDELIVCHLGTTETFPAPRTALQQIIAWHCAVALDPKVSAEARALIERQPMTDAEIAEMALQEEFLLVCDGMNELREIIRAVERHHHIGITKKESGNADQ